jgi:beta-glucosidase
VAVLGPNAVEARTLGGGSATVFPPYTVSPVTGLHTALGPDVQVVHARGGRSTHRLPPARRELLHRTDGSQGVEVRFLDADGAVLGTEERNGATFNWLSSYGPDLTMDRVRAVEVVTRVRADQDGTYRIGASGVGPFRVTIAGEVRVDTRITLPPGADAVEGMMRPPQESVPVPLRAGEEVEVVVRHEPESLGGFGDADTSMVAFQVNAAPRPTTRPSSRRRWRWRGTPTWPSSSWGPPRRWRARASTAPRWRCPVGRTSWSGGWRRSTRAPWSW